jgi:hypothetical protein
MHFDLGLNESSLEGFLLGVMHIQWIQFPLLFISGEFFFQGLNFCLIKVSLIIDSDVVYMNATASLLFLFP